MRFTEVSENPKIQNAEIREALTRTHKMTYTGSWIQLTPSPADEITGGLPLDLYSANGSWPNGKEGYVPSVLHQLHCVVRSQLYLNMDWDHS